MRELTLSERLQRANWFLLLVAIALSVLGVLLVEVASRGEFRRAAFDQIRWTVIGVAACMLVLAVPYERLVRWRYVMYGVGLILLVAVLVIGVGGNESSVRRWVRVGTFKIQPSEFMKVIVVITLAGYFRYERSHRRFQGLARPFLLTFVPLLLIVKQPDLGTALLLLPVLFVLLYVAGARRSHLAIVAGIGLVLAVSLYLVEGPINEYQKNRIRAFAHQGSGHPALLTKKGHQLHQSKIVVGSASALGAGLGEEGQDAVRFLSQRHTDFIFPVLVSSFGSLGALGFLLVYLLLIGLMLRTALRVREPSGRLLAVGVATLFACQGLINMAMTVGLLPVVGMPLPFISKGGSSLLASFVALGLVLNVGADSPVEFGRGDFD
jgi:rod shape determining protein RodA